MKILTEYTGCLRKYPLWLAGLFQAIGIIIYCFLVGLVFWKGNEWFGKMSPYLGPVLVLTLLSVSVLICALIAFTYPALLFWDEKKTKSALNLVAYMAMWLFLFVFGVMIYLSVF